MPHQKSTVQPERKRYWNDSYRLSWLQQQRGSFRTYPQFHFHKYECCPSGIAILCAERLAAGRRYAHCQRIQCRSGFTIPGFAVAQKRECHTAVCRIPENSQVCHQGGQRPVGSANRKWRKPGTVSKIGTDNHWHYSQQYDRHWRKIRSDAAVLHCHIDLHCHDNLRQDILYQLLLTPIYFCTVNPFPRFGGASLL